MAKVSAIRQNFSQLCEDAINEQINLELYASYTYLVMAHHFDRDDMALKGFYKFFKESSDEEREHAQKFISYQHRRGGKVVYKDVKRPSKSEFDTGLSAMEAALALERDVNESLLKLHTVASQQDDPHLTDYLEGEFLDEQVESMKQISDYITNLKRVGPGLGEFQFDKLTLQESE